MCNRNLVTLATLAAGAYFGAPALFGEGVGASAGSLATANAVGAAGGDAIGSLIASNAGAWGVTVAPEIAATGLTAAAGNAASALSGLKTAAKVAPLATLLMGGQQPERPAMGTPAAPPQAASAPEQNVLKKKGLPAGDPTLLTGPGGVPESLLTLGRSTLLGA